MGISSLLYRSPVQEDVICPSPSMDDVVDEGAQVELLGMCRYMPLHQFFN